LIFCSTAAVFQSEAMDLSEKAAASKANKDAYHKDLTLNKRFILFSVTATNLFVAASPGRSLLSHRKNKASGKTASHYQMIIIDLLLSNCCLPDAQRGICREELQAANQMQ